MMAHLASASSSSPAPPVWAREPSRTSCARTIPASGSPCPPPPASRGEVNGVNYWFLDDQQFTDKEEAGDFLETATVHGLARYGTPLKPVQEHLAEGVPTILEIDLQGARRVKQRAKELGLEVVYVFIAPPSFDELVRRLKGRGTETPEEVAKRLETAHVELSAENEFDVTIVNDDVDKAAEDLWRVIASEYGITE